ncbi:vasorin [Ambystoma mexicanum]|uniref:vasorin n=1 Tax=Ambystoma mexicanum TaxID=8296 RepID=UPI0037E79335
MCPLLMMVLLVLLPPISAQDCPQGCLCNQPYTVFCISRRSPTTPKGLRQNTANLYVFENGITDLEEDSFAGLPELQLLDLSQNKISSLPRNTFQSVTNLNNLDLSSNQIREITNETFHGLRRLERLYLNGNQIQRIDPNAFDTLERLLELKLQNNRLTAAPLLNLPQLLLLDLSWNEIPVLEARAFDTSNLESLKIAGLGLSTLNDELFESLMNLHELDLSDNHLAKVPMVLHRLQRLTKLSLAGNARISHLQHEDFVSLQNLQELNISNINLRTIPQDFFSFSTRLKAISVAKNPFNCICQMSWFAGWVNKREVTLMRSDETRCHFPPKNAGKILRNLEHMDFGCPTTTATTTIKTTTPMPILHRTTSSVSLLDFITSIPTQVPTLIQEISTHAPIPAARKPEHPQEQLCPPQTCLNGGSCQLDADGHLKCACLEGFLGLYCESKVKSSSTLPTVTVAAMPTQPTKDINIQETGSTSLKVDLHSYIHSRAQLKGIRLTYRNLSGPDKRPISLNLPTSLSDYTVRSLKPNSTYHICVEPFDDWDSEEKSCVEAQTAPLTKQHHAPVIQTKDSNLTLMIVPALAATLLLVVAVAAAIYYLRSRRSEQHIEDGRDLGPMELEGVKECLDNGDRRSPDQKPPEPNGLEYEIPLMHQRCHSNNNNTAEKPSYF